MNRRSLRALIGAACIAILIAAAFVLPLSRWALELVDFVRAAGVAGVAVYGAVYVIATLLLIPGSLLTIGAGFAYGLAGGVALVWPSAMLGAIGAFLIGRFLARDWVRERATQRPRLAAIDGAIGERGLAIVLLVRLSPLFPFTLLNYSLGITRARLRDYALGSAVGMVPGTFLYVYIGSLITDAAALSSGERPDTGAAGQALFWGGLVATAAVTVVISRLARAKIAELAPAAAQPDRVPDGGLDRDPDRDSERDSAAVSASRTPD